MKIGDIVVRKSYDKDIIFKIEETKTGLFKTTNYQINVAKLDDILEFIKNYLTQLFEKMSLQVNFESSISNNQIYLKSNKKIKLLENTSYQLVDEHYQEIKKDNIENRAATAALFY